MAMTSLENSEHPTKEETAKRRNILMDIIEEAKNRKDVINENYLLYHMKMAGYTNYNRVKLYNDRLELDSQNNYIRHFLPKYSKFQEDILLELEAIRDEAIEMGEKDWGISKRITKETKDGTFITTVVEETNYRPKAESLKIRAKVAELKQKHAEGQNVQISAVIVQKELQSKKAKIIELSEQNKKLTVLSTKDQN